MPTITTTKCRGCGQSIAFVKTKDGKTIPLDARSPVYLVSQDLAGDWVADRLPNGYVTHFATCPKANDFSASKRGQS